MMAVIGGTLTAESPPNGGTCVTLTFPAPLLGASSDEVRA
jgi:signal transduction histidine kinase